MDTYCAYLRKSRADRDAELRGEGETLARHKAILTELSARMRKPISRWYSEVVSGDSIASRPIMQELLYDIEQGLWSGVFVVEIERLARGDSIDQGIVSRTFQLTETKIITPIKTYDPGNEFDSEYFEFSLFMSRREYKTITRRMQAGRMASVKEGNYIGSVDPYGYRKVRLSGHQKGFTLEIIPKEARVVENIFHWFCIGDDSGHTLGRSTIATRLNRLCIPTKKGNLWTFNTVEGILANPLYAGKVRWNFRQETKRVQSGEITKSRPRNPDVTIADGKHPPIIDADLFDLAQRIRKSHSHPGTHVRYQTISNPFAGLIECGVCHHHIQFRRRGSRSPRDTMLCVYHCGCVGSYFDEVEAAVLNGLREILQKYDVLDENVLEKDLDVDYYPTAALEEEMHSEENKLEQIFDYLEKGIYTVEDFTRRKALIEKKIQDTQKQIDVLRQDQDQRRQRMEARKIILPKVRSFLDNYDNMTSAEKNTMLREIVDHMVYTKTEKRKRGGPPAAFSLDIYPKIPLK